jgi:UDP-N-acetylglucosamine--N-acetylmuramyl-(pentapeptide) pyrophosphoryl-undecaprenol N-acetylglucosamine transferase
MSRTVMIMAGGTGGHVFPALAVADELATRGWSVVWLGTKAGIEAKLVAERGYPIEWLSFSGLRGKGLLKVVLLPLAIIIACAQSLRALNRRKPSLVLGMGGYAAFPGGLMGVLFNRPLVIHEQNSVAGLTNRVLAALADRVLVGFPKAFETASSNRVASLMPRPKAVEWVGNPVRTEIAALPSPTDRYSSRDGKLRLLVIGGSQGAQALNEAVPKALALLAESDRPTVIHQAGSKHIDALKQNYAVAGVSGELVAFIDDMAARYAWCDLVVCRAGALTVAEITAAGVASIFVPFPTAVDDHQTGNAKFLVQAGAADLLPQSELTPERLAELIKKKTRDLLKVMAEKARALAKPDATMRVADICVECAR